MVLQGQVRPIFESNPFIASLVKNHTMFEKSRLLSIVWHCGGKPDLELQASEIFVAKLVNSRVVSKSIILSGLTRLW